MQVAIGRLADAVDNQEFLTCIERDQGHVPGAAVVVDALAPIAGECTQLSGVDRIARRRNDNQHPARRYRYEGLTAVRMSLDHVETMRQLR